MEDLPFSLKGFTWEEFQKEYENLPSDLESDASDLNIYSDDDDMDGCAGDVDMDGCAGDVDVMDGVLEVGYDDVYENLEDDPEWNMPLSQLRIKLAGATWGQVEKINSPPEFTQYSGITDKLSLHGDEYINRKGWCSLNVQATCDGKERFTSLDAQWPGSVHDSRILKRSNIFGKMRRRQQNGLILGDEGYGITPWLLTPYRNPTTPQEIAYNSLHKRERDIIERCFRQLKRRFPVLQHQIRLNIDKIPSVIVSAVVLHNVAKYLNDQLPNDEEEVAAEDHDGEEVVEDNDELNNDRQRGQQRREEIKNIIFQLLL
ncbi:hypothetical protein MML48_9g00013033 [Holotrichia oblita]|uniref:Uncharacterized protein n=1 Tax=Holotrichia oblita TaxID=644536 RepID=A0ACB9SP92_HOLOL|nr:hypothetical protein MML48_9g00013033 [Holotrichia oblita]